MNKIWKRILSAVMALAMVLTVMSVSAFAAQKVKHYDAVTTLGDSISDGFSMPDYMKQANGKFVINKIRVEGSYADLVTKAVGAKRFHPLAQCGYRTVELRMALDPSYKGDVTARRWQARLSNAPEYTYQYLTSQYPEYEAALKDSDLVLLDIGYNDTWLTVLGAVVNAIEETPNTESNMETLDDAIQNLGSLQNVVKWAAFKLQQTPSYINDITTALKNEVTCDEFKENYDVIVKKIFAINPKTTVVALSTYNPFKDWNDVTWLAPLVQSVVYDKINAAKESYTKTYGSQYIYVTDFDVGVRTTSAQSILNDGGWDPHPTAEGHQYIANQIINALPKA